MTDVLDSVRNSIRQGEPPENIAMQHEIPVSWVYEEMFNLAEIGESK